MKVKAQQILCCYNVNIDSVCTIDGAKVGQYLRDRKIADPPESIDLIRDMDDLLALLLVCMRRGTGGEYQLETPASIRESLSLVKGEPVLRLGGNAGIAADVLSKLGAAVVIPNVASLSRKQADLLKGDTIRVPVYKDGGIVLSKPCDAVRDEKDSIHYVFDFKKGEEVALPDRTIRAPCDNRLIATYDPRNISIYIDPAFEGFSDANIREMDGVLVAGLHMLQGSYPDGSTYLDRMRRITAQMHGWKSSNPDLLMHFESGDFLDGGIRDYVIASVSGIVDSIGMNEQEFLGDDADVSGKGIIEKSVETIDEFGMSRLCIHARDFIVSTFDPAYIDPASEIDALTAGAAASAVRAERGYVDKDMLPDAVLGMMPNDAGIRECSMVREYFDGAKIGNGVHLTLGGYSVCIVPSLWCKHPITTVGLGDTMTAAVFLRELELTHRNRS
ncbi:MAG: ADP-dependent glucokinase/phosphofructokinase [Euryarchaeota archaeon]|nr:ADP-dependent glucokinase/phosphofructokinase [Euryarchaeota archaeon]